MNPGRFLIWAGAALIVIGLCWGWIGRPPIGRLPGDILVQKKNFTVYFPLGTCLAASAVLTLVFRLFSKR